MTLKSLQLPLDRSEMFWEISVGFGEINCSFAGSPDVFKVTRLFSLGSFTSLRETGMRHAKLLHCLCNCVTAVP